MTPNIAVLRGSPATLVDDIAAVRSRGDIPLVGDDRWPAEHWSAVRDVAAAGPLPHEAAWASLTSGTSGRPRVVLRTAASWERSFAAVASLWSDAGVPDAERQIMLPAPPASSLTLFSLAHALHGGPQPVFPGSREAAGATLFHGTPHALRTALAAGSLPQLRTALVGGSHLDAELRRTAQSRGVRVISYYGAAELSFVAVDEIEVRHGALWVRSPYIALGYLGTSGPLRADGDWATVGDLATVSDGALTVHGRADSAILAASATVIPDEVEAGLRTIPGITDAVVVGIPTDGIGALVAAVVEQDPAAARLTARRLRQMVAARFAPAHRPRLWFTGELPRTTSGKPARAEILRRILTGEASRLA